MTQSDWMFARDADVDHFRVIRPLGKGAMAEVYLARDMKLGRKAALKVETWSCDHGRRIIAVERPCSRQERNGPMIIKSRNTTCF